MQNTKITNTGVNQAKVNNFKAKQFIELGKKEVKHIPHIFIKATALSNFKFMHKMYKVINNQSKQHYYIYCLPCVILKTNSY